MIQEALMARSAETCVSPAASTPPPVMMMPASSLKKRTSSGCPVTWVPLYGPANALDINDCIWSRPFRHTPGRIMDPSPVNTAAKAAASWFFQADTIRCGTAAAASLSAADSEGPAGDWVPVVIISPFRFTDSVVLDIIGKEYWV